MCRKHVRKRRVTALQSIWVRIVSNFCDLKIKMISIVLNSAFGFCSCRNPCLVSTVLHLCLEQGSQAGVACWRCLAPRRWRKLCLNRLRLLGQHFTTRSRTRDSAVETLLLSHGRIVSSALDTASLAEWIDNQVSTAKSRVRLPEIKISRFHHGGVSEERSVSIPPIPFLSLLLFCCLATGAVRPGLPTLQFEWLWKLIRENPAPWAVRQPGHGSKLRNAAQFWNHHQTLPECQCCNK